MLKDASARESINSGHIPYEEEAIQGTLQILPAKTRGTIEFNDRDYHEATPSAGGGWGDPIERDPALVIADIRDHAVSAEMARAIYGVVAKSDGSLDEKASAGAACCNP